MTPLLWFLAGATVGAYLGLLVASMLLAGHLADLERMRGE